MEAGAGFNEDAFIQQYAKAHGLEATDEDLEASEYGIVEAMSGIEASPEEREVERAQLTRQKVLADRSGRMWMRKQGGFALFAQVGKDLSEAAQELSKRAILEGQDGFEIGDSDAVGSTEARALAARMALSQNYEALDNQDLWTIIPEHERETVLAIVQASRGKVQDSQWWKDAGTALVDSTGHIWGGAMDYLYALPGAIGSARDANAALFKEEERKRVMWNQKLRAVATTPRYEDGGFWYDASVGAVEQLPIWGTIAAGALLSPVTGGASNVATAGILTASYANDTYEQAVVAGADPWAAASMAAVSGGLQFAMDRAGFEVLIGKGITGNLLKAEFRNLATGVMRATTKAAAVKAGSAALGKIALLTGTDIAQECVIEGLQAGVHEWSSNMAQTLSGQERAMFEGVMEAALEEMKAAVGPMLFSVGGARALGGARSMKSTHRLLSDLRILNSEETQTLLKEKSGFNMNAAYQHWLIEPNDRARLNWLMNNADNPFTRTQAESAQRLFLAYERLQNRHTVQAMTELISSSVDVFTKGGEGFTNAPDQIHAVLTALGIDSQNVSIRKGAITSEAGVEQQANIVEIKIPGSETAISFAVTLDSGADTLVTAATEAAAVSAYNGIQASGNTITLSKEAFTKRWVADEAFRKEMVETHKLRTQGGFTALPRGATVSFLTEDKEGKLRRNVISVGGVIALTGGLTGEAMTSNATLAHETLHGIVRVLRDTGMLKPGDDIVKDLIKAYGEAAPGVDELFNEEALADALQRSARIGFAALDGMPQRNQEGFFPKLTQMVEKLLNSFFGDNLIVTEYDAEGKVAKVGDTSKVVAKVKRKKDGRKVKVTRGQLAMARATEPLGFSRALYERLTGATEAWVTLQNARRNQMITRLAQRTAQAENDRAIEEALVDEDATLAEMIEAEEAYLKSLEEAYADDPSVAERAREEKLLELAQHAAVTEHVRLLKDKRNAAKKVGQRFKKKLPKEKAKAAKLRRDRQDALAVWKEADRKAFESLGEMASLGVPGARVAFWDEASARELREGTADARTYQRTREREIDQLSLREINVGDFYIIGTHTLESKSAYVARKVREGMTRQQAVASAGVLYPEDVTGLSNVTLNREIYGDGKGGESPDQVAQSLYNEGLLRDYRADTMWEALRGEIDRYNGAKQSLKDDLAREVYESIRLALQRRLDTLAHLRDNATRYSVESDALGDTPEMAAIRKRYTKSDGSMKEGWMKAPNGQPTKLTERQWLQVRTAAFKRWFGDWEKKAIASELDAREGMAVNTKDAVASETELGGVFLSLDGTENAYTGQEVTFPQATVGKVFRHKGVSVTLFAKKLGELFNKALPILIEPEVEKDGHKVHHNIKAYHHYLNKVQIDNETYYVRFTVREEAVKKSNRKGRNEVHSTAISSVDVYKTNGASLGRFLVIDQGVKEKAPFTDHKIARFLEEVNQLSVSRVIDENGEPLVVYHGTKSDFTVFDLGKSGANYGGWNAGGTSIWFAPTEAWGKRWARKAVGDNSPIAMPCFVSAKNPFYRYDNTPAQQERLASALPDALTQKRKSTLAKDIGALRTYVEEKMSQDFARFLVSLGFDAYFVSTNLADNNFAVFAPTQIKSATDNVGTFDGANPDIRYSVGSWKDLEWTGRGHGWNFSTNESNKLYTVQSLKIDQQSANTAQSSLHVTNASSSADISTIAQPGSVVNKKQKTPEARRLGNEVWADATTRYAILGEKGIRNLSDAQRVADNLTLARMMEQGLTDSLLEGLPLAEGIKPADPKTIRLATGWERGADGKWRYEIPDGIILLKGEDTYKARFVFHEERLKKVRERLLQEAPTTLGDIYHHPELYNAYPWLEQAPIELVEAEGLFGAWNADKRKIMLNKSILKNYDDTFETLVHEIQHAIQDDEGFATGGSESASTISRILRYENPEWEPFIHSWHWFNAMGGQLNNLTLYPRVDRPTKERIRKFLSESLSNFAQTVAGKPYGEQIEELLTHTFFTDDLYKADSSGIYKLIDDLRKQMWRETLKANDENAHTDWYQRYYELSKFSNYDLYRHLAGEVEARNVSKRNWYTSERRRNRLLAETEDVAREDQIILDATRFSVASDVSGWLKKRTDLAENEKASFLQYLDTLPTAKEKRLTGYWFAKGTVRVPEDQQKIHDAIEMCARKKADPMRFSGPAEVFIAYGELAKKDARIDPDTVPTLSNKQELPEGVTVYDVEDSETSRQNMRQIIDTHWGKDANPWCLLQGDGEGNLTEESARYWEHYDTVQKRVAFQNGKLLAFCASDDAEYADYSDDPDAVDHGIDQWWDRKDELFYGIPLPAAGTGKFEGYTGTKLLDPDTGTFSPSPDSVWSKGKKGGTGSYEEYYNDGHLARIEQYENGKLAHEVYYSRVNHDRKHVGIYENGNPIKEEYYILDRLLQVKTFDEDGNEATHTQYDEWTGRLTDFYDFTDVPHTRKRIHEDGSYSIAQLNDYHNIIPGSVRIFNADGTPQTERLSVAAGTSLAKRENFEDFKRSIQTHPLPEGVTLLSENATPQEALAYYNAHINGKTFTLPTGETFTFKPGHFFRLVCKGIKGGKKGYVEHYTASTDALEGIQLGNVSANDVTGYEASRAQLMPLVPDLLENAQYVVGDGEVEHLIKRYNLGDGRTLSAIFRFLDGGQKLLSFHATSVRHASLKQYRVIFSDNAIRPGTSPVTSAMRGALSPDVSTIAQPGQNVKPRYSVAAAKADFVRARRNLALSGLYEGRSPQVAEILHRVAAENALALEARRLRKAQVSAADVRRVYEDFGVATGKDAQRIASAINKQLKGTKKSAPKSDRELLSEALNVIHADADFLASYKRNQMEAAVRGFDAGFKAARQLSADALEMQRVHKSEVDTLTGQNLRAQEARLGFSYLDTILLNPTDEMRLSPEERAARAEKRKQQKAREAELLDELEAETKDEMFRDEQGLPERPDLTPEDLGITADSIRETKARQKALLEKSRQIAAEEEKQRQARAEKVRQRRDRSESPETLDTFEAEAEEADAATLAEKRAKLFEGVAFDLESEQDLKMFVTSMMIDCIEQRTGSEVVSLQQVNEAMRDPVMVRDFSLTMASMLTEMADNLCHSYARENIRSKATALTEASTWRQARTFALTGLITARNAFVRENQTEWRQRMLKLGKAALTSGRYAPSKNTLDRKVSAQVEAYIRAVMHVIKLGEAGLERYVQEQRAVLERVEKERNEKGETDLDIGNYRDAMAAQMKLDVANTYGAWRYKPLAALFALEEEFDAVVNGSLEEHFRTKEAYLDEIKSYVFPLVQAMEENAPGYKPDGKNTPWRKRLALAIDRNMGLQRLLLEGLLSTSTGETRAKAKATIDNIVELTTTASVTYNQKLREFTNAYRDVIVKCYGSVRKYQKRMDTLIPEELNQRISRRTLITDENAKPQQRNRLRIAHVMHLYGAASQSDYANNIRLWQRDGDSFAAMRQALSAEDLAFLAEMSALMRRIFPDLQAMYQRLTGHKLGTTPGYLPVKMYLTKQGAATDAGRVFTPIVSALEPRKRNGLDFDESARIDELFSARFADYAHMLAYGERGQLLQAVFGDKALRETMRNTLGDKNERRIQENITTTLLGPKTDGLTHPILMRARAVTGLMAMSFNPGSVLRQTQGLPAFSFIENVGLFKPFKALASSLLNWRSYQQDWKILTASEAYKSRYDIGMDQNMRDMQQGTDLGNPLNWWQRTYSIGMIPMKEMDKAIVRAMAVTLFRAERDRLVAEGCDEATAQQRAVIRTWARIEETQQSSRPENQLRSVNISRLIRIFYQFKSAPLQQLQWEGRALSAVLKGEEGAWPRFIKTIIASRLLIPLIGLGADSLLGWILGRFDDDDEEQKERYLSRLLHTTILATLSGPLSTLFVIGGAIDYGYYFFVDVPRRDRNALAAKMVVPPTIAKAADVGSLGFQLGRDTIGAIVDDPDFINRDWDDVLDDIERITKSTSAPGRLALDALTKEE